ncbi:DUF1576 domain-containing protein [Fusibacter bizertensis]|uniref:DUF1576 domain-containing protein n=1 Tax=Fusibacter bizertensis TaxID=1488331 RepID=A0ABT6NFN2_9FIRM|nr:DUF1576 domain-containing protein [Fusibacter bizertensis]MDH8679249.1 DUF1576 domain-containing protein [Fusibacter bizertensis]
MAFANKIEERDLHKEQKILILAVFPLIFLIFGVLYALSQGANLAQGMTSIIKSPTTLITDFMVVGGIGAAFVNSALIGFFNLYLLKRYKMRINGLLIAAFFTVLGFSFFGKNVLNILPIYLGGYLYARYQQIPMKNVILVIMFSTALAPIVSFITFGGLFTEGFSYLMGLLTGISIGFIIVPLSSHMIRFHDGYNLYNIGFTAGIVGTVITSALRSFDVEIASVNLIHDQNNPMIIGLLVVLFVYLMGIGLYTNKDTFKLYKTIFKYRGRTITDFTSLVGYGLTFFNMGVLGMASLIFVLVLGGVVNGPVMAGILTIVGFAAFGKQPKNCFPIVLGVLMAGIFFGYDFSSTTFIISALFSTTIAPIAGAYGPIIGVIAGMLHLTLVTNIGIIHGGINLYNNGFSGGLVAGFMLPIIDAFKRGESRS